ncbi:chloride channel protein [Actinomyces naeslundii]|uniref:chloride channel protein n=1 Tax=Actinomyces naeslundii TaxID=1655 RepID=UPI00096F0444|nr:chloride channel protein [Actinomyces naeslundii]OMG35970.1 chemotaxis protein CheW [Actinomyces naeslundii]
MRALTRPRFLLAAALAGVAAGLVGIAMALLLELFESLFYGVAHGGLLERLAAAPPWRRALAPAMGGLVAGGVWWWLRATGGVADVETAVADRSGREANRMGLARPFLDAVTQVLTVGSGNSVGREGAPRLAAGAVAAGLTARLGIGRPESAILIASAAGAGLAAMYNAPLGGAVYAIELVMVAGMRQRGAFVAVPVCVIATLVSWLHSHGRPAFEVASQGLSSGTLLGLVLLVPVAAALGVGARRLWSWMLARRVRTVRWLPVAIGVAGLATGLVSLWVPAVVGNGRDAMEVALGAHVPEDSSGAPGAVLVVLLGIVALKPVLTGLTLGAGATGGRLAPSLAVGSSAGAALAIALQAGGVETSISVLAMAGAGAVLATTQKAPVFGIVFTWELARAGVWTLVALIVVVLTVMLLTTSTRYSNPPQKLQNAPTN